MTEIVDITAREILDSRGNPTVEVDVILDDGSFGRAAVPSGASTGAHEAVELRDGEKEPLGRQGRPERRGRRQRRDLRRPVRHPTPRTSGASTRLLIDPRRHREQGPSGRQRHPGRQPGRRQGRASSAGLPLYKYVGGVSARVLPTPMMNIINGGAHADNPIDIQEFMILPTGAKTFAEGLRMGAEIFHALKKRS